MLARLRWEAIESYEHRNKLPVVDSCKFCECIWLDDGELEWLLETKKSDHRLVKHTYPTNDGVNKPTLTNAPKGTLDIAPSSESNFEDGIGDGIGDGSGERRGD
jgi:Zn-finger nucleic acid-binding protein